MGNARLLKEHGYLVNFVIKFWLRLNLWDLERTESRITKILFI